MKFSNKQIIIALGGAIISIGIIAIGSVLYYQKNQQIVKEEQKQAILDTTNWKTFRNEKYKYSVQYPQNWKENPFFGIDARRSITDPMSPNGLLGININIEIERKFESLEEYIVDFENRGVLPIEEKRKMLLDGEESYLIVYGQSSINPQLFNAVVITFHNSLPFSLYFLYDSQDIFEKIVSTFKFID